jgi:hypothetical protein
VRFATICGLQAIDPQQAIKSGVDETRTRGLLRDRQAF